MRSLVTSLVTVLFVCHFGFHAVAENWPQFRGANEDGVVQDAKPPMEWDPKTHILWKVKLPGVGWSQPIVWGGKMFITTAESDNQTNPDPKFSTPDPSNSAPSDVNYRQKVLCLDVANGHTLWERTARDGRPTMRTHINNTYATETPVTDGERIVAYFGMAGVYCYDFAGNRLWSRDLGSYPTQNDMGSGSSPILFGDKVYIQCDNEQASFLVALDKKTGNDIWRVDRQEQTNWSTPYIWKNKLRTELIAAGGGRVCSYDPQSGKLLWSMNGSGRTATTPVGTPELLYVDSYTRETGLIGVFAAIRPGAAGDISLKPEQTSNKYVAWSVSIRNIRVSSPVICRDCVYILAQLGAIIRCLDANTGQEYYRERLPGAAAGFTASALASGDKIYCIDQRARTHIIEAGPKLRVLKTNKLNEEMCWASPVAVGERIYVRTVNHLFAIGEQ
jgi:outer membrane protein assembly factor BamB